jgi:hypothetical protein
MGNLRDRRAIAIAAGGGAVTRVFCLAAPRVPIYETLHCKTLNCLSFYLSRALSKELSLQNRCGGGGAKVAVALEQTAASALQTGDITM